MIVGLPLAVIVGVAVGALTAYAQGWLSDSTASLANSAGPWCAAAFLVARFNRRLVIATLAAVLTLACCELGYAIATVVRGDSNSSSTVIFWLTAAALAGPPLGVAAAWSTSFGIRQGLGFAVIGGVLIGEGLYGWNTVADTTDWRYWVIEATLGLIVVAMAAVRSGWPFYALAAVATGVATSAVVYSVGRLA